MERENVRHLEERLVLQIAIAGIPAHPLNTSIEFVNKSHVSDLPSQFSPPHTMGTNVKGKSGSKRNMPERPSHTNFFLCAVFRGELCSSADMLLPCAFQGELHCTFSTFCQFFLFILSYFILLLYVLVNNLR